MDVALVKYRVAAVQTPNQAVSVKMLHDQSPAGSQRYRGLNFFQTSKIEFYRSRGLGP